LIVNSFFEIIIENKLLSLTVFI